MSIPMMLAFLSMGAFIISCCVFIARYSMRPWRVTKEGRTIMFLVLALVLTAAAGFLFRFIFVGSEWATFRWLTYTILFGVLTGLMLRFNFLLVKKAD